MRSGLRAEPGAQAGRRPGAFERLRLRRHQRDARVPEVPRLTADRLRALEARLGHRFADPALLTQALTHASYANEHPPAPDQEPLAFVGDAALGLVVAERLFATSPGAPVGVLTPERAAIVSGANIARWAAALELGPVLRLGRGEDLGGGRGRDSILATSLEAVLGAVYLEAGLDGVRRIVGRLAGWCPEGA